MADTRSNHGPGMGETARVHCPAAAAFCSLSGAPPRGPINSWEASLGCMYIMAFYSHVVQAYGNPCCWLRMLES